MNQGHWFFTLAVLGALIHPGISYADDAALLSRVQALEGEVQFLRSQLGIKAPVKGGLGEPTVSAEDQHIQEVINSTYPWLKGTKPVGDIRLRMENFARTGTGKVDQNRFRLRLRWGLEKNFNDDWKAGFRLATGARDTTQSSGTTNDTSIGIADDPTSTNQTFTDKFNLKDIFIENAWASYTPSWAKNLGPIRGMEIKAGKVELPWKNYSTSIVWDGDVTPEGAQEKIDIGLYEGEGRLKDVQFTGLFGQWILNETASLEGDQEMYSYTGALESQWDLGLPKTTKFTSAFNFFDYVDIQDNILVGNTNRARGNDVSGSTLLVDDWNIAEWYNEFNFRESWLLHKDLKFFADAALNTNGDIGNDSPAGVKHIDERNAYSFGAKLGSAKKKGDWELAYQYFRIERNSTLGLFSESDLGVGHNNHTGSKISTAYGLTDNLALNFTAWFVNDLSNESNDEYVARFQSDLVWKLW